MAVCEEKSLIGVFVGHSIMFSTEIKREQQWSSLLDTQIQKQLIYSLSEAQDLNHFAPDTLLEIVENLV